MTVRDINRCFLICLFVLGLTYGLSYFPLGRFVIPVIVTLSAIKTYYVMAYFMELKRQKFFIQAVVPLSLVWAITFFILTFADYLTR